MISILYYRKKDTGEITSAREISMSEKIQEKLTEFNSNEKNDRTAHIEEYAEDSLTVYLYKTKYGNIEDFKNYLNDVVGRVDDLSDDLSYIRQTIEKLEGGASE